MFLFGSAVAAAILSIIAVHVDGRGGCGCGGNNGTDRGNGGCNRYNGGCGCGNTDGGCGCGRG